MSSFFLGALGDGTFFREWNSDEKKARSLLYYDNDGAESNQMAVETLLKTF